MKTREPATVTSDVAAFELLTRALLGIALESMSAAEGEAREARQVSLPQFRTLLALDGLGRISSSTLAAHLGLAASAITRMVDRLQNAGLVERGADARNRCIHTVELTQAGRELVSKVLARRHARLAEVLARMSPDEHEAAVQAARLFARLSGDAIALAEFGPVPV